MRRPSGTSVSAAAVLRGPTQAVRLLLALLVATVLLVVPTGAHGQAHAAGDDLVLAVEEGDLGPEPAARDADGNPARELAGYEDRDVMFTWGASFLLLGLVVTLLVIGGALWYLLVLRPSRETA